MEESGKGIPDRFNLKTDMKVEVNEKAIHRLAVYGKNILKRTREHLLLELKGIIIYSTVLL